MDYFMNFMKSQSSGLDGTIGTARFGLVSSFDPSAYAARVLIQPENVLSGWLPVVSCWVGAGWGISSPLIPGAQVLVISQEGDAEQGVIIGAVWSNVDTPMPTPVGELWLQHQGGSSLKLFNNGTIGLTAPVVNITGNLMVTGNISDQDGAHGSLSSLRTAYDMHVHAAPQGGDTSLPSVTV